MTNHLSAFGLTPARHFNFQYCDIYFHTIFNLQSSNRRTLELSTRICDDYFFARRAEEAYYYFMRRKGNMSYWCTLDTDKKRGRNSSSLPEPFRILTIVVRCYSRMKCSQAQDLCYVIVTRQNAFVTNPLPYFNFKPTYACAVINIFSDQRLLQNQSTYYEFFELVGVSEITISKIVL